MKQAKVEKENVEWDKGRIVLFLVASIVLLAIGFEAKSLIIGDSSISKPQSQTVKGAETKASDNTPNIKKNIQDQINSLQKDAQSINIEEMATSSPQVQKIIKDLQGLKDLPKNQIKDTCEKICSGL